MESLRRRMRTATDAARGRERKRVTCIQWTEPVYAAGAWVPELIAMAGGQDTTCTAGGPSITLSQQQVRVYVCASTA
jgi:iron complex transport system substrate-binding protein